MAAPQHQKQQQEQQQLQSPAQLGDEKTTPGSSTAGPNQEHDSQEGLSEGSQTSLVDQGNLSPPAHLTGAAAENGQKDLTPQYDAQPYLAGSNFVSTSMHTTNKPAKSTLSAEERDRLVAEWKDNGKPSCPGCKKKHPPPCDTARVQELASIKALRDKDPEAYEAQMAAFQAKYSKKEGSQSVQKRKAASSDDAGITDRAAPAAKKGRKGKFNPRLCKSCQEYHPFGQHTKTKQEAQDLVNQQLRGLAPIPNFAAVQAAKDEWRQYKIANAERGQRSTQEQYEQYDQRRAEQRERERANIANSPAMFSHLMQQQCPEAGFNFLVGLHNGSATQFLAQLQYPMPAYGDQAQPQYLMPTYGYQAQPQHPMPTPGYQSESQRPMSTHGYQAQPQHPVQTHGYQAQPQYPVPTYGYPAPIYPASTLPGSQHQSHKPLRRRTPLRNRL